MKYIRRSSTKSERELFDELAKEFSIKDLDEWYKYSSVTDEITQRRGFSFVNIKYGGNLARAIMSIYPEHKWKLWNFKTPNSRNQISKQFWEDRQNRTMFCEDISKRLGIKNLDDWYTVDLLSISKNGGSGLLRKFDNSLYELLKDVYPTHDWKAWNFTSVHQDFWLDMKNQRQYFDYIAKKLNIQDWSDWYSVSYDDIWKNRGAGLLNFHYGGSLLNALAKVYPENSWNTQENPNSKHRLKTQTRIFQFTKEFFPNVADIHLNYWFQFKNRKTVPKLELDIFIPSLHLAIEYQGRQHFRVEKNDIFGDNQKLEKQIERDREKLDLCKSEGISLVIVPFWWNGSKESLGATIAKTKPELATMYDLGKGNTIPENPP